MNNMNNKLNYYNNINYIKDINYMNNNDLMNNNNDLMNSKNNIKNRNDLRSFIESNKNMHIIIKVGASWCGPCRKEHKNLMKLSKNKNLKIIGINFKDDKINAENFLKKMGNPFFISTVDPKGIKSVNFGIYGIPETILLNQELEILKNP